MIVKIQLPIGGDMSKALVYNKDRSVCELMPVGIAKKAFGRSRDVKGYFYALLDKTILRIGARAPEQNWSKKSLIFFENSLDKKGR